MLSNAGVGICDVDGHGRNPVICCDDVEEERHKGSYRSCSLTCYNIGGKCHRAAEDDIGSCDVRRKLKTCLLRKKEVEVAMTVKHKI
jgi:hypothetical protein